MIAATHVPAAEPKRATLFMTALLIIPILAFLILVHELGHYMAARRTGMRVEEFGLGLPPRIWGKRRGPTLWSINAIPFGGFVRVLGEDGKNSEGESMQSKTAGQRALFITAGSAMNFLTAFVLIALLLGVHGRPDANAVVADVAPNSPAEQAGWEPGDQFLTVDGRSIQNAQDFIAQAGRNVGNEVVVVLLRDGVEFSTTIIPRTNPPEGEGPTGIRVINVFDSPLFLADVPGDSAAAAAGLLEGDQFVAIGGQTIANVIHYDQAMTANAGSTTTVEVLRAGQPIVVEAAIPAGNAGLGGTLAQDVIFERVGIIRILPATVSQFFGTLQRMGEGLMMLITGQIGFRELAGPIGMGQLTSEVLTVSSTPTWVTLTNLTILLSLNLAILNLLPLPALDGGRLVFVILEVLRRGKRVAPEKEGMVHFIGLVVLLGLMFVIAFVDIDRIVSGDSLLQ